MITNIQLMKYKASRPLCRLWNTRTLRPAIVNSTMNQWKLLYPWHTSSPPIHWDVNPTGAVRSTLGYRSFPVAAAWAWNALPQLVRNAPSLPAFRRELKTVLFRSSFPDAIWQWTVLYLHANRSMLRLDGWSKQEKSPSTGCYKPIPWTLYGGLAAAMW